MSSGLPFLPGYSSYGSRNRKKLSRFAVFQPIEASREPTFLNFLEDKQVFKTKDAPVLTFYASFDDRGEPPRDREKFRDCHILYFVEDDTIKVYEPWKRNSGMPQGVIVGRNRLRKPQGGLYTLDDLNIGETVIFYGKPFKILDCDPFTKNILKEMGYRVRTPEPKPVDPVSEDRHEQDKHWTTIRRPGEKSMKSQMFLQNFPNCLRFYGIYKRTETQFDEERYVSLYYQLYDGKIKLVDDQLVSDYQFHVLKVDHDCFFLLKPSYVPRTPKIKTIDQLGNDQKTILNLSGKNVDGRFRKLLMIDQFDKSGIFLVDTNPIDGGKETDFLTDEDLDLGKTIDIFGAKIFLYDCTEFTKKYYEDKFERKLVPVPLPETKRSRYNMIIQPQEFGDQIDSLFSWKLEGLKSHKKFLDLYEISSKLPHKIASRNLLKFHLNSRDGVECNVLKFVARILTDSFIKRQSVFVVAFHLEDDTIKVYRFNPEFTQALRFGKEYLRRMKVVKPTTHPLNANNCLYKKTDFYVGSVICIDTEQFYLFDADEYTYEYMTEHCDEFPHSDLRTLMNKFRNLLREKMGDLQTAFEAADMGNSGTIPYNDFRDIMQIHLPKEESILIPEQEIITLARFCCVEDYVGCTFEDLVSRIQADLKRRLFLDFNHLKEQFEMFDLKYGNRTGFFTTSHVYDILVSSTLKIDKDLLKFFILKFPKKDGMIDYHKVIESLDYIKNPSKNPDHTPYALNINWKHVETVKNIDKFAAHITLCRGHNSHRSSELVVVGMIHYGRSCDFGIGVGKARVVAGNVLLMGMSWKCASGRRLEDLCFCTFVVVGG
ncbi:EF-hand domain-containing family member C2 [Caerostris darwini]|uniref:EF-hand domain-containing family member C2 n=1 Tax=Caerostris darwini TaxID=1538125 RepID=A0AAV4UUY3_9ARAC|nr:EF-hand domain-containing family member C2 [Caerostris darwini]